MKHTLVDTIRVPLAPLLLACTPIIGLAQTADSSLERKAVQESPSPVPAIDDTVKENGKDKAGSQKKVPRAQLSETGSTGQEVSEKRNSQLVDASEPKEHKKSATPKPATHKVKSSPIKIEVALDGIFESKMMAKIAVPLREWTSLKVLSAVEHGTRVEQGDLLVVCDTEAIDRAIADLRESHKSSDLSIELAERQLATLQKTTTIDLAAMERSRREEKEDLDYFRKVARPLSLESLAFMLKSAEQHYEYQAEEVRQLEKMYAADDLTEETEEIILTRARNDLAAAEFNLKQSRLDHQRAMEVQVPRRDKLIEEASHRAELRAAETIANLPIAVKTQELALAKTKLARSRSEEKLQKLITDRAAMTVKAPNSGIVYYGKCSRGRFSTTIPEISKGSTLMPRKTLMTIVQPRPLFIRTSVTENQLRNIKPGIKGTAKPTAWPDMSLATMVEDVATVPRGTSFDTCVAVSLDAKAEAIMPGMTCKMSLVAYENKHALTVPPKAVARDNESNKYYVCLIKEDGAREKRYVEMGQRTTSAVEILEGLTEGDEIVPVCPKDLD